MNFLSSAYIASLPQNMLRLAMGIFALLAVASVIIWTRAALRERAENREHKDRVRTFWIIAVLALGSLTLGRGAGVAFLAFVSFLALREYLALLPEGAIGRPTMFTAYALLALQYGLVYAGEKSLALFLVPIGCLVVLPVEIILKGRTEGFVRGAGMLTFGLLITVYGLGFLSLLFTGQSGVNDAAGSAGLVVFVVLLTQLNDVGQYIWGKSLGKRRIAPRVSPNKTVAGFVGGALTTTVLAFLFAPYLTTLHGVSAALLGLGLGVSGFFGDLLVSAIKRDFGIKDTAQTLPGHGGVLDRVDSLVYTAPFVFLFLERIS